MEATLTTNSKVAEAFGLVGMPGVNIVDKCARCGATPGRHYLSEQRDGELLCSPCINEHNRKARAARKAQLAAMERCAVPGCKARGNLVHNGTLICGRHFKRAKETVYRNAARNPIAMFQTVLLSREGLIAAATAPKRPEGFSDIRDEAEYAQGGVGA